jgi:hypothetical protein
MRPPSIVAFQTPANLSADFLQAIVALEMLDQYAQLSAKYLVYNLSYQQTTLKHKEESSQLVQFDITHIDLGNKFLNHTLGRTGQQIIQLRLDWESASNELRIEDVGIVDRSYGIMLTPEALDQKYLMTNQIYASLEWDSYGCRGELLSKLRIALHWLDKMLVDRLPVILMVLVVLVISLPIRWYIVMNRRAASRRERAEEAKVNRFEVQDLKLAREKDQA